MSASVFPARAGMSPNAIHATAQHNSVPRASGDEPGDEPHTVKLAGCSPRERG